MIRLLLPAVLGLVAIVSFSFYEGYAMKDRWNEPGVEAKELGERFAQVPLNVGDWEGEDLPVDEVVRKTAGAIGYVSRRYINAVTGKEVVLWLIVGHSRDITRHTPNICYPSSGFRQVGSNFRHHIDINSADIKRDDIDSADINSADIKSDDPIGGNLERSKPAFFFTSKFEKENEVSRVIERVFWTFNHPDINKWEAPEGGARMRYGLSRALYKLYFTSAVRPDEDTIEDNVAVEFAELMLPKIDAALFPTESPTESQGENGSQKVNHDDTTSTT